MQQILRTAARAMKYLPVAGIVVHTVQCVTAKHSLQGDA